MCALPLVALACSAKVGTAGGGSGAAGSGGGGTGQPPTTTLPPPAQFKPAPARLRRLTAVQYGNTLVDLFGPSITVPTDLEPDTSLSGFASIGAALVSLSPHLIEQLETASLAVARQAMADPTGRVVLVGCNPTTATDDACVRTFITKFGRRAWRRPLAADEVAAYAGLVGTIQTSMKDFFGGLAYGIAALLQSPHFLYREELGTPEAANASLLAFDDHELATRLSFFLWNSTPDDALLDAADAHQLTQGGGFLTQVQRLLASPRAVVGAKTFFTEYFRLAEMDALQQLPSVFPQKTATLGPAMREETLRFLTDIAVARDADFREFLTSSTTFVNAELAKLYGLPAVAGTDFVKATLPDNGPRVGYLGQGSFLALNAHSDVGSPTYRGKFIREMLTCTSIPPPPMNVPPLPQDGATGPQTMRQKLAMHRAVEPCKTCHTLMDPLGLAFENFDGIGAYRAMDAGQVIDASGDLDGVAFAGPRALATLLKDDPKVADCVARNLYRYVTGHIEVGSEEPAIVQLAQGFKDGTYKFSGLVMGMVKSSAFALAGPPVDTGMGAAGSNGAGGSTGAGGSGAAGTGADASVPQSDAGTGPVVVGPVTYAANIAPILAAKCSPCHTTQAKAGVNFSYDTLVTNGNVTNALTKSCVFVSNPPKRIVPGDPDHSLLWIKINSDTHQAMANNCGDSMPLPGSGQAVTTAELDTIQHWIQQGAKP